MVAAHLVGERHGVVAAGLAFPTVLKRAAGASLNGNLVNSGPGETNQMPLNARNDLLQTPSLERGNLSSVKRPIAPLLGGR